MLAAELEQEQETERVLERGLERVLERVLERARALGLKQGPEHQQAPAACLYACHGGCSAACRC